MCLHPLLFLLVNVLCALALGALLPLVGRAVVAVAGAGFLNDGDTVRVKP